jgi:NAD(P)-dependent dehydrogenase (short-subunit alcohol dehydrogenase family)
MSGPDLTGKRVLVLGAETEVGRAVAIAVAEAGASLAAVAATSEAEAAFAVQRLARRLSSGERKVIAQAIEATNEAAVRVMVRQVSKELGGLDAVVSTAAYQEVSEGTARLLAFLEKRAEKEMRDSERGIVIATLHVKQPKLWLDPLPTGEVPLRFSRSGTWLTLPNRALWERKPRVLIIPTTNRETDEVAAEILSNIASPPDRR